MRLLLSFLSLLFCLNLSAQDAAECAVNAGPDKTICCDQQMVLDAPVSQDYNTPANPVWTFISGPQQANIVIPKAFNTPVTFASPCVPGQYVFEFCADCKDLNGDGTNDRPCDQVVITVTPPVAPPTITPANVTVCNMATFTVTPAGPGETASAFVDDGGLNAFTTQIVGNQLIVKSNLHKFVLNECDFMVVYSISNGGCSNYTTAMVHFTQPYDPNLDGLVEGHVESSCDRVLRLRGDHPGCDGSGTWAVNGPGIPTFVSQTPSNGDADVLVSQTGVYTLTYTVTSPPCSTSTYTFTHQVVSIEDYILIPDDQRFSFCDNIMPAGTYCFTFNELEYSTYEWHVSSPAHAASVQITNPNSHASCLVLDNPIDLSASALLIYVTAYRYYIDPDCDGPLPPYYSPTIPDPDQCYEYCEAFANISFVGEPKVEVPVEPVRFLCSDCHEDVFLKNYAKVVNFVPTTTKVTVVSQPSGSAPIVNPKMSQPVALDGCGEYVFKLDFMTFTNPICTTTVYLTFILEQPKTVSAGTPQKKCYNETIRLNGNMPYGPNITGTWTQIDCPSGTPNTNSATFSPHDPNTVVSHGLSWNDLPKRICFEWSFGSENPICDLSDVTWVDVDQCLAPCPDIQVVSICENNIIKLTALDGNGNLLPDVYNINWTITNGTPTTPPNANPQLIPYPGNLISYQVDVSLVINDETVCEKTADGRADCGRVECGARVVEKCDECGMIVVTLVDAITGDPIVIQNYEHEVTWWVNGHQIKNQNPIKMAPGSCYKMKYFRYTYPPGSPHVPGLATICEFDIDETCPTLECPGPCNDMPDFFLAGYGDAVTNSLGLPFPSGSYSFCSGNGLYGTIGIFSSTSFNPADYIITWENGSSGLYVTGSLFNIDYVKIVKRSNPCCYWEGRYRPVCCENVPTQVHCENPIIKHCDGEGGVTYTNGSPQIAWEGVTGATGYEIRVTLPNGSTTIYNAPYSPWMIPAIYFNSTCIIIEVRAVFASELCDNPGWSEPFEYCYDRSECERTLVICGCCGGERSNEGLREVVVSEETIHALLDASPGLRHATLQQALAERSQAVPGTIAVFPNPANTRLEVKGTGLKAGRHTAYLYDLLGRVRLSQPLSETVSVAFEVASLPTGVYLIAVKDANGAVVHTEKVSIVR